MTKNHIQTHPKRFPISLTCVNNLVLAFCKSSFGHTYVWPKAICQQINKHDSKGYDKPINLHDLQVVAVVCADPIIWSTNSFWLFIGEAL